MLIQPNALRHGISILFRIDAINFDITEGPSKKNPGGGLATKCIQVGKALPQAHMVIEANQLAAIGLVDPLYFSGGGTTDEFNRRIEDYRRSKALKILWTCDMEILRWSPEQREAILDATDIVAANSKYMYQVFKGYLKESEVALLTDPIEMLPTPPPDIREKEIYACSQIIYEKGISDVIEVFKSPALDALQKTFIGSSETWGLSIRDKVSFELECEISACSHHHESLAPNEVSEVANRAWIFLSFANYESFGYAMVEALRGGCYVFCKPHLAYQDRIDAGVAAPVATPEEAIEKLVSFTNEYSNVSNKAGMQFVHENYSLDVFRKQFQEIVGKLYGI